MFIFFLLTSYHSCPSVFISGVFWKSIHFEVASDSFSLLINSSWLLVFATILFVLIFPYIIYLVSLIFFSYHFWCRDLLRELDKKYEVLLIIFFLLFGGVLVSEALLFVSFFWASFHSLSSITLGIISHEAFYLPDPCELTFANTLLLSNAAISLGITFTSLEVTSLFYLHLFLSFTLCSLFISLQGKEFRILALLINDSLYSCLFFTITGLHFFHLVYGLLLLSLLFWGCSFSYPGQYTFL
jgi:heme/copper-type cytochrome/quinol oxidase subunit 3